MSVRSSYPTAVEKQKQEADGFSQGFYVEIQNTIIAVQTMRYRPRKSMPEKIYNFGNDTVIDNLAACIQTMREFGIASRERMDNLAAELEDKIIAGTDKNEILEDKIKLARISSLIKTYERIAEGNFIDNLIKAQKEQRNYEQNAVLDNQNLKKS